MQLVLVFPTDKFYDIRNLTSDLNTNCLDKWKTIQDENSYSKNKVVNNYYANDGSKVLLIVQTSKKQCYIEIKFPIYIQNYLGTAL